MVWECLCACLTTHLSGSLDGGAVFKKEFDDFNSILFARDVKWSESIQCSCVHFSLNVKRKNVKWSEYIQCLCVHFSLNVSSLIVSWQ